MLLLLVEACVWREVEVVGVGDVASLFPARAFVWGDVDPHGNIGVGPDCPGQAPFNQIALHFL